MTISWRSAVALLALAALFACTRSSVDPKPAAAAEDVLIVPGQRVGPFVLGRDTLASILGEDTPEERRRFTDQGLYFQFERGGPLTGITVMSERYATAAGLRAGMPAAEVEAALGKPLRRGAGSSAGVVEPPLLAYEGIAFQLQGDTVTAISVDAGARSSALPEEFLGRWYYTGSSGGLTGKGLGDAAAGTLVIRADGTLERHGEDGALTGRTRCTATRGRTIFSEEEQWMLTSESGVPEVIRLSADGQTMTLAENVHDGFSRSFARSR